MIRKLVVFLILISAFAKLQSQDNRGFKPISIKIGEQQTKLYNQSHALVIGISSYTGGWPNLPGVKNDIVAVKAALEQQGFDVTLLENATKEQIDKSISDFINKYGQESENRLLFYFAGHGHTIKTSYGDELGYIVPIDAPNPNKDAAGFQNKAMEMAQIEIYAKRIQSKHALFLFDACFSGSLFALSRAAPEIINYKISQPVRQFISSGSANETVPDVSVFRKQFVAAITTLDADANKDGYLTGTELGDFLQTSVVNYSNNTQHPQFGKIRNPNLDKGDFVFVVSPQDEVTATGSIQLISEISGKLYIDGVFYKEIVAESTTLINNIQSGLRIINIRGTSNWTEKVMVITNQTTTIRAKNKNGTIVLNSEISGKLYVDNVLKSSITKGSTTILNDLTAGVHDLKIEGSQPWTEKVNVSPGQITNITASPEIITYTTPENTSTTNADDTEASKLKIGDNYAGGIIFYLDNTGKHGKVCATEDQSNNAKWNETKAICTNLTFNGYSDWYLPSEEELNDMYKNLHLKKKGSFSPGFYWSSSENSGNETIFAWGQNFNDGYQLNEVKKYTYSVRAVRAF